VRRWAAAAGALYRELHSTRGHDAFLLELDQVGAILRDTLAIVAARDAARARLAELELAS
jgi:hypothetical protein